MVTTLSNKSVHIQKERRKTKYSHISFFILGYRIF
nr:MAG TPA: hypothetical protein [Caudoviricetes sp.]